MYKELLGTPRTNDDSNLSRLRRNTSNASLKKRADTDQALLDAAKNGDTPLVKRRLDAGADANLRGRGGWTPLMYAVGSGHAETAKVLIGAGADPDKADTCGVGGGLYITLPRRGFQFSCDHK